MFKPMPSVSVEETTPPWARNEELPDAKMYLPSECFVAGAISTQKPFSLFHPAWALPVARKALEAISEWSPDE